MDKKYVLLYGLYIGWLLSFIFNGPLFNIIITSNLHNTNVFLLAVFFVPASVFFFFGTKIVNRNNDKLMLRLSIGASVITTIILIIWGGNISSEAAFIALLITTLVCGFSVITFILSSTGIFIRYISFEKCFMGMAHIIVIANICVFICTILIYLDLSIISCIVMLTACIISLALSFFLKESKEIKRPDYIIKMQKGSLFLMCISFFLFNIGAGIVFEIIDPLVDANFGSTGIPYVIPYIIAATIIIYFLKKNIMNFDFAITLAVVSIVIGFLLFQYIPNKNVLLLSSGLAQTGYALMDTFMWGLVGMLSYVYYEPYKIVSKTMFANVYAVIIGVIIAKSMSSSLESYNSIAVLFSLLACIGGILIIPYLHKRVVKEAHDGHLVLQTITNNNDNLKKLENFNLLTVREKEVCQLLFENHANKEIAQQLYISENTLKKHAKSVYEKMNVANKKELASILEKAQRG